MAILNPTLFKALQHAFNHVTVANQGMRAFTSHRPDWRRRGRLNLQVSSGEYYRVNCPFCDDTRQRLWVHYVWGTRDERTGLEIRHPVHCFNEGCIDSGDRQMEFRDRVYGFGHRGDDLSEVVDAAANSRALSAPPPRMPDGCIPINDAGCPLLPQQYLISRGLNLDELWNRWRVFYCRSSPESSPPVYDRIVIPVFRMRRRIAPGDKPAVLAGWQARRVRDGGSFSKYLNTKGMGKSRLLYGLPQSIKRKGPVVICEGVTDVWRLGRNAVCLFGKDMSTTQLGLLTRHFPSRPIVVFLDRDAANQAQETRKKILSCRRAVGDTAPVVVAALPGHRNDVGECLRDEAWDCVSQAMSIAVGKSSTMQ